MVFEQIVKCSINLILLGCVMFLSCSQEPQPRVRELERQLSQEARREDFGSYGFLSASQGMVFDEGRLFFSDLYNSRVLVLDPVLSGLGQIGSPGQGPGELGWVGPLAISQGRLFAANVQQQCLTIYDKTGTFLDIIPVPYGDFATQFAAYDDVLFLSTPKEQKIISAADRDGKILYQFGEPLFKENPPEQAVRNGQHLGIIETPQMPVLVALNESEPELNTYSLDGVRLHHENLSKHPLLQSRLGVADQFRRDHPDRRANTTIVLFSELCVNGQELYALVADQKPPFHVLQFHVDAGGLQYAGFYSIRDPMAIQAMAVAPDGTFFFFDAATRELRSYRGLRPA